MILKPNECTATENFIIISRKALEEWRDHYMDTARDAEMILEMKMYYSGKADALIELLKHFEEK